MTGMPLGAAFGGVVVLCSSAVDDDSRAKKSLIVWERFSFVGVDGVVAEEGLVAACFN